MAYEPETSMAYWNDPQVESMYDKHLLSLEIKLILRRLRPGARILDAGCGEGEGTLEYSRIENTDIVGADFSETRLAKAAERLRDRRNVELRQVDFVAGLPFESVFDFVVSQRFLINLTNWELQQQALLRLKQCVAPGGSLLMLEGSQNGVDELNEVRMLLGLEPIPVRWHNLFFDDAKLVHFMESTGYEHAETEGLGAYFLLTRGLRPFFERTALDWDTPFNALAARPELQTSLAVGARFSRLKLWVFRVPARSAR